MTLDEFEALTAKIANRQIKLTVRILSKEGDFEYDISRADYVRPLEVPIPGQAKERITLIVRE